MQEHTREELDRAYLSLAYDQKRILDEHVKRGRKTKWLNTWADKKGIVLSAKQLESPDETMNSLLEWVLVDYEEKTSIDPNMCCECGRALKRRYTVRHNGTGKIYRLGEVHFVQHTGLDPEIVRLIRKGLAKIDLERDEILSKVIEGWQLSIKIPESIEIPQDISEQIRVQLPLLDRQVNRLMRLIVTKRHKALVIKEKQQPPSISLSYDEFTSMLGRLKTKKITPGDVKRLYEFIKNDYERVQEYGFYLKDIREAAAKALGYYSDRNIRQWLVELECLNNK